MHFIKKNNDKLWRSTREYRQSLLVRQFDEIDAKLTQRDKKDNSKKAGPRQIILDAYKRKNSKKDAYFAMKLINDRIGREAYTQQVVDGWIAEYEKSTLRDDGRE